MVITVPLCLNTGLPGQCQECMVSCWLCLQASQAPLFFLGCLSNAQLRGGMHLYLNSFSLLFSLSLDVHTALLQGSGSFPVKAVDLGIEAVSGVQEMAREMALLAPGLF